MKKTLRMKFMLLLFALVAGITNVWADDTYVKVTSSSQVTVGSQIIIVCESDSKAMTATTTNYPGAAVTISSSTITLATSSNVCVLTIGGSSGNYTLTYDTDTKLCWKKNGFQTNNTATNNHLWSISDSGVLTSNSTNSDASTRKNVRYNTSNTDKFGCYTSGTGNGTCIYVKQTTPTYTINAQSNNEQYGTVSLNGSVITGSPKSGCRYASPAYSVSPANSATVSQDGNAFTVTPSANTTVTINFEAIPTYTVTLGDDSSTLTETIGGAGVTLPTRPAIGSYDFAGWSETNVSDETTTAPTIIPAGTYYPTSDITLYPVYTRTEGGGEAPSAFEVGDTGEYAIVSAEQNGKYYALPTNPTVSSGKITAQEITISEIDGVKYITPTNASGFIWTIASATNGYTLHDGSKYIYHSNGGSSGTNLAYGTSTSYTWSFTIDGEFVKMNGMNGSTVNSRGLLFQGTTIGGYALSNWDNSGYYKSMILPISAGGSTTYYWSSPVAPAVATPAITVADNPFYFSTTATITCATDGATIKYSYDGETWNDYSAALTITETTTVYAKAIKDAAESSVASVDITKNLATLTPSITSNSINIGATATVSATGSGTLPTITLTTSNSSIASVSETTVTGVAAGSAIITATWSANADYNAGNQNFSVTVVDPNAPGTVNNPYTVAQAINAIDNSGNVTGVYATGIVSQVTYYSESNHYINYYISADGLTSGQQLEAFHGKGINGANFSSINDVKAGDVVVIYGNLTYYSQTSTYEFEADNQLVSLRRISIDHTELSFSYVQNTAPGSANEKELTVSGEGLNENITVALGEGMSAYYELIDLSGDDWTTDPIVLTIDGNGDVEETTIGVRIKSGLGKGVYNGNLNITSGNVSRVVTLSGSVTAQLYDITFNQPTGGTLSTTVDDEPVTSAEENAVVTLVATPETGYSFVNNWAVLKDDLVTPVEISEGTFTMPNCDVIVSGTFSQINYIIIVADTQHGTVESSNETANYGDDIIVTVTPETGYRVQSFTVAETGGAGTVTEIEVADDTYSFDMPAFNITVTVVFEVIPEAYSGGVFELHTGNITEGYYIITYNNPLAELK